MGSGGQCHEPQTVKSKCHQSRVLRTSTLHSCVPGVCLSLLHGFAWLSGRKFRGFGTRPLELHNMQRARRTLSGLEALSPKPEAVALDQETRDR